MALKDRVPPPPTPPGGLSKAAQKRANKKALALTNGGVGDGTKGPKPGGGGGAAAKTGENIQFDRNKRTASPRKRMICWNYNKGTCTRPDCKFAHVCALCGKEGHPARLCGPSPTPA